MTSKAKPTEGPYGIIGDSESAPGVPCIEINAGEMGVTTFRAICDVSPTLKDDGEFVLTPENWATARLLAASWDMREALEKARDELNLLTNPHIIFDVHQHADTNEWCWGTESQFFQGGGLPWTADEDVCVLLLDAYREELDALVHSDCGYAIGIIPVTIGRFPEDPPWEPVFSKARLFPLEDDSSGCPALDSVRTVLAQIDGEGHE